MPDRFCEHDHWPLLHCAVGVPHDTDAGTLAPPHVGLATTETANMPSPDTWLAPHALSAVTRMKYVPFPSPDKTREFPVTFWENTFDEPATVPTSKR